MFPCAIKEKGEDECEVEEYINKKDQKDKNWEKLKEKTMRPLVLHFDNKMEGKDFWKYFRWKQRNGHQRQTLF